MNKGFIKFFKQLRKNNDRDWFNAHKKEYISEVKEPFEQLVANVIAEIQKHDPRIVLTPKEAIFRIYRDTRFSKDKTPYKEHVSAAISPGGRKDMTTPGIYIQANDVDVRIYSGMYMPDKENLQKIREAIASDLKGFRKLINRKSFIDAFGEVRGEKNKRLPKEFVEAAEKEPLIYNKGFYYFAKLDPEAIADPKFPKEVVKHWKIVKPLNDFFENAIK